MIGHPSGDEPLMVDVRQSGSGSLLIELALKERFVEFYGGTVLFIDR
jgi:hypothetical protein